MATMVIMGTAIAAGKADPTDIGALVNTAWARAATVMLPTTRIKTGKNRRHEDMA
jgi:hypothetical protein